MTGAHKMQFRCYLCNRHTGIGQACISQFHFVIQDILFQRNAVLFFEISTEIAGWNVKLLCQVVDTDFSGS